MPSIHLVRHAQPDFHGNYDSLTSLGYQQSEWLGSHFAALGIGFARIVCGSLVRQAETARTLAAHLPTAPDLVVDPRFNEYDARSVLAAFAGGADQAMRATGDRRAYFTAIRKALTDWSVSDQALPGGETWSQFGARVRAAFDAGLVGLDRDAKVLVITSGGVIGRLVADVLGANAETSIALNLQARNTGVTEFVSGRSATRLVGFNAVPHLEQPGRTHAITYS
jgi:broad specificity phosphatase PhoE